MTKYWGENRAALLLPKRRSLLLLLWGSSSLAKCRGLSKNTQRRLLPESSPEEARGWCCLLGRVGGALLAENRLEKTGFDGGARGLKCAALGAAERVGRVHFRLSEATTFFQTSRENKSRV